jgi:hypothetical protein
MRIWIILGIGVLAIGYAVYKTIKAKKEVDVFLANEKAAKEKKQKPAL